MRLGQFLFSILVTLVLLALIGIVDWSTVGDWALVMLVIALMGPVLLIISYLVLKVKDNREVISRRLGFFFNWVIVISGFVILVSIISIYFASDFDSPVETNISAPNYQNEKEKSSSDTNSILLYRSENSFTPRYLNKNIKALENKDLFREIDTPSTHFLNKNAEAKVIDETKDYIQISTTGGPFWTKKDDIEIVNNTRFQYSDEKKKINNEESISKFGNIVIDSISVRKEPDLFSDIAFKLYKGDRVYVLQRIPDTIYFYIRVRGDYYYIMENAVKFSD